MTAQPGSSTSCGGSDLERQALAALRQMRERAEAAEARVKALGAAAAEQAARSEPLAIVGMACRFPGAPDLEAFWHLLLAGGNAITEIPAARWSAQELAAFGIAADAPIPRRAGLIEHIDHFDAEFFGITGREAQLTDPQQRIFLETTWQALERAGIPPLSLKGSRTGVFVGTTISDYLHHLTQRLSGSELDAYLVSGNTINATAGRVAYTLGLQGPAMAIDTACSSSLVAIDRACRSVREGESRLAIAGGVNIILAPELLLALARWGMLAPDGHCKVFDASANGFVRAEGCGVVLIKRLTDARADGDRIWALVRGGAVNQAGASGAFAVPNGLAQAEVLQAALQAAGVQGSDVAFVEAHGTGTSLGDPIEMEAIASVYGLRRGGDQPLWVGAVKSNVGHLECAAGVAGFVKTVLALQHRQIPPNVHFNQPTSHIPWAQIPVRVPTAVSPLPAIGGRRLAAVSAFGFSGTNAHMVLEEAPQGAEVQASIEPPPALLLTLSARHPEALRKLALAHAARLENLASGRADAAVGSDVAYCLASSAARSHLSLRWAATGAHAAELAERLRAAAAAAEDAAHLPGIARARVGTDRPGVAFFFTGQGAQYAGMGRRLAESNRPFRGALERVAAIIDPLIGRPLLPLVFGEEDDSAALLNRTAITQPALFAVQVALVEWWRSVGITPALVAGHSVGEFAAAWCAGVLELEEAARLVTERGALMQSLPAGGAMAAILASEDTVRQCIQAARRHGSAGQGVLAIAGINGPAETVVAGDGAAVQALAATFEAGGVRVERLAVSHAFHSPLMAPMAARFADVVARIRPRAARVPVISSMTGRGAAADWGTAQYWLQQLREPVRWFDVLQATATGSDGIGIALEIGPQPILTGLGRRGLPEAKLAWLPSLRRGQDDGGVVMTSLAELYARGAVDDWSGPAGRLARARADLPVYPFQSTRHWVDREVRRALPQRAHEPSAAPGGHALLGAPLALASGATVFQALAGDARHAWVREHRLHGHAVWPATASVEMLLAAARVAAARGDPADAHRGCAAAHGTEHGLELCDVEFRAPLVLTDNVGVPVQALLPAVASADVEPAVRLCRQPVRAGLHGQVWPTFASARVIARLHGPPATFDLQAAHARCLQPEDAETFHAMLAAAGADFGPSFKRLDEVRRGDGEALANLRLPANGPDAWLLHPALLDAALQLVSVADFAGALRPVGALWIPARIERLRWHAPVPPVDGVPLAAHARLRKAQGDEVAAATRVADIVLARADGTILAEAEGVHFVRGHAAALIAAESVSGGGDLVQRHGMQWHWERAEAAPAVALAPDRAPSSWLIVTCTPAATAGPGETQPQSFSQKDGLSAESVVTALRRAGAAIAEPVDASGAVTATAHVVCLAAASPLPLLGAYQRIVETLRTPRRAAAADAGAMPPRLWIVTRGAQCVRAGDSVDPAAAALWGLARVVRNEQPEWHCTALDLEAATRADELAAALALAAACDVRESQLAWRHGALWRVRLAPWKAAPPHDWRLVAPKSGRLEDLQPVPHTVGAPGPGEVSIEVRAAGLNFRDVLSALGMVTSPFDTLGGEVAGRVSAVGPAVTRFAPGDEVMALALGGMATRVNVPEHFVTRRPRGLSSAEAAALPIACLTASYGLEELAALQRGQRVLIHAATGGVGTAAVHLARLLGAEVFASAGSAAKRQRLRAMGVRHVFDSRRLDFAREVRQASGGAGVHVVLNALAGEFIPAGLSVLEPGGCFLEMGKRGVWSDAEVQQRFPGIRYRVFDLGDAALADAALAPRLFARLVARLEARELPPLPVAATPMRHAEAAFQTMAHAGHLGKLVLMRDDSAPAMTVQVRPDASYLVTGGFGAIGQVVAAALASRGARHLWLLGRHAPGPGVEAALSQLARSGVKVQRLLVDVADATALRAALQQASKHAPPLAGVVHCAGVLDDALLARQDADRLARVLAPKLVGATHLAAAVAGWDERGTFEVPAAPTAPTLSIAPEALDFFVLFSAGAAWLGMPGQANYAAANAALEALALALRGRGVPATAIAWGRWAGEGMAAPARGEGGAGWAALGAGEIGAADGMSALVECIARQAGAVAVLPMDWPTHLAKLHAGVAARAPACFDTVAARRLGDGGSHRGDTATAGGSTAPAAHDAPGIALAALQATPGHERRDSLQALLLAEVRQVAGLPPSQAVPFDTPLRDLGLDSLMSVELRNALGARFGRTLSATLVFDHPTLNAMTDQLLATLPGLADAAAGTGASAPATVPAPASARPGVPVARAAALEVQALTDDEAEAELLAELARGAS